MNEQTHICSPEGNGYRHGGLGAVAGQLCPHAVAWHRSRSGAGHSHRNPFGEGQVNRRWRLAGFLAGSRPTAPITEARSPRSPLRPSR